MLFWVFLVRCSSRRIVIFLIVSKEIEKYDQRKFYFFSEKTIFKFGIHVHRWKKKIAKKIYNFFSVHQNCKIKNSQKAKFRIKIFAKYNILQTSNAKEIRENIVKKIFAEIFLWKEKFSPKKIR